MEFYESPNACGEKAKCPEWMCPVVFHSSYNRSNKIQIWQTQDDIEETEMRRD